MFRDGQAHQSEPEIMRRSWPPPIRAFAGTAFPMNGSRFACCTPPARQATQKASYIVTEGLTFRHLGTAWALVLGLTAFLCGRCQFSIAAAGHILGRSLRLAAPRSACARSSHR